MKRQMKTSMATLVALALMGASIARAANLFPAQDYSALDGVGAPEGWKISGPFEFKSFKDTASPQVFSLTSKEKGPIIALSPSFPVDAGKTYVLTLKIRSANFGELDFNNVNSYVEVRFNGADEKRLPAFPYVEEMQLRSRPTLIDFPYTTLADWTQRAITFVAPADASSAYLFLLLNNEQADDTRPEIQVCNINIQEIPTGVLGDSATDFVLDMLATQLTPGPAFGVAVDGGLEKAPKPDAQRPASPSWLATARDIKGKIGYSAYKTELSPGIYELTVRMKTDDNSQDTPVFAIEAHANPIAGALVVRGTDFEKVDTFQEFKFRFLKPNDDWRGLPCYKVAGIGLTLDTLTVALVKQFDSDDLKRYFPDK